LELTAPAGAALTDGRTGTNIRHSLTALLRQSIYGRLAGYDDLNDADRLAVDPVLRQVVGGRATEKQVASTSQMGRFETEVLTQAKNLTALMELPGNWIDKVHQRRPIDRIILDLDSSVSETHGQQEGSAYHGYFECPDVSGLPPAVLFQSTWRPGACPAAERQRGQRPRLAQRPGTHTYLHKSDHPQYWAIQPVELAPQNLDFDSPRG